MKYHIKTFGCQMNVSDSERIAGFLEACKIKPAKEILNANFVIFNTCGVRQMAEDRVYGQVHNLRKNNSKIKIILTGCLANRKDVRIRLKHKVDLFCDIKDFPKTLLDNLAPSIIGKRQTLSLGQNYLCLTPRYSNKRSAFVPIMTGCNNFCAYCVVPYARGREISRPLKDILSEVNSLSKSGYKEITLLGQNVNSYSSKKTSFPDLLDNLAKSYPEIIFRFLTSHPKDFSEKLMDVIARNKNIGREIHLPLQAGSDKILKVMNRPYTQKNYLDLIEKARQRILGASFTTDVIVGFPGETIEDFQESVKVFTKVNYNEAYINKYSPRPDTSAWELGDSVPLEEKKRREKILREIVRKNRKDGVIIILGPTSSGKSDIAIKLARKFNGEILSADSRQIYRGMDIGTGKVTKKEQGLARHHMLDIASPRTNFSAAQFKKKAEKIIEDILKRKKLPIICGGTGFWIKSIVDNVTYPEVRPDWKLRNYLSDKTAKELFSQLQKLDPERAKTIDTKNKVRLIRALEICKTIGQVPREIGKPEKYSFLQIGIDIGKEKLNKNIKLRLKNRFKQGMIEEVEKLHHKNKISWKRLESFGLGYKLIPQYLKGEIKNEDELFEKIYQAEKDYAKRQMTWFGKDKRIIWLVKYEEIEKKINYFTK